jgi:hypothetical protein
MIDYMLVPRPCNQPTGEPSMNKRTTPTMNELVVTLEQVELLLKDTTRKIIRALDERRRMRTAVMDESRTKHKKARRVN